MLGIRETTSSRSQLSCKRMERNASAAIFIDRTSASAMVRWLVVVATGGHMPPRPAPTPIRCSTILDRASPNDLALASLVGVGTILHRLHVRAKHRADPCLIARPLRPEPGENISVHTYGYGLFQYRRDELRLAPEVVGQVRQFGRRRAHDFLFRHPSEAR